MDQENMKYVNNFCPVQLSNAVYSFPPADRNLMRISPKHMNAQVQLLGQFDPRHELIIEDPYYVSENCLSLTAKFSNVCDQREGDQIMTDECHHNFAFIGVCSSDN